jgi:thioredoxin-related protein
MKSVRFFTITIIVICLLAMTLLYILRLYKNSSKEENFSRYIPEIEVRDIYSNETFKLANNKKRKSIVCVYDIDCYWCQQKLILISEHSTSINNCNVYFVSESSEDAVKSFISKNNLKIEGIHVCSLIHEGDLMTIFDIMSYPRIFVYDEDNKLIKDFINTSTISDILQCLSE